MTRPCPLVAGTCRRPRADAAGLPRRDRKDAALIKLTDRELDAYLAEHLLDWYYDISPRGGPYPPQMVFAQNAEQAGRRTSGSTFAPPLSSTGDGMLLVLEAMHGRGYLFIVRSMNSLAAGRPGFMCTFAIEGAVDGRSEGDSLPRSVAEAAKSAILATEVRHENALHGE